MVFPFFTVFFVFVVILAILRSRSTHQEAEKKEAFLERESKANGTRKVNLDTLTYLVISPEDYPLSVVSGPKAEEFKARFDALRQKRMLNLNGLSNTELKLYYGPANLEALTAYGDSFSQFTQWIVDYATFLEEQGFLTEAISVLEKGISLRSDLSENYIRLANLYQKTSRTDSLRALCGMTDACNTYTKPTVDAHLASLLSKEDILETSAAPS